MPLIDSTVIARVEWQAGTLLVWFRYGDCYAYDGVSRAAYRGLLAAGSAGAFFAAHIRNRYACRKVSPAAPR